MRDIFFSKNTAVTFDDVLIVPEYSEVIPTKVFTDTQFSKNIRLNIPLVSSAMDTVTEYKLAIAIAQLGGVGIIHKNLSAKEQAEQVSKVKRFKAGIVGDPITATPDSSIKKIKNLSKNNGIFAYPVLDNGKLLGMVTARDLRLEVDELQSISTIMTPLEKLVTIKERDAKNVAELREMAVSSMYKNRVEKIPIVDDENNLTGLITLKDVLSDKGFPSASIDKSGRLLVGASIGISEGDKKRVELLLRNGVDIICIDTAHGHSKNVLDFASWVKKTYEDVELVVGNVATRKAALDLEDVGADAIKIGIGPGSICTTRYVAGVGVPQLSAIIDCKAAVYDLGLPIIADGGIRYSGDIAKCLVAGASSVMVGSVFAGTTESPGEVHLFQGRSYKLHRGMGSLEAMMKRYGSSARYFQEQSPVEKLVPEGIEGRVPYKGDLAEVIHQLMGGVRSSMGYCGCPTIKEFQTRPKFVKITTGGIKESHVHDVFITKESPNYRLS